MFSFSLSLPLISKQLSLPAGVLAFCIQLVYVHEDVTVRRTMFGLDSSASKRTSRRTNSSALVDCRRDCRSHPTLRPLSPEVGKGERKYDGGFAKEVKARAREIKTSGLSVAWDNGLRPVY